jgi:ribosomal protein S18 acetylase RimI-like enzyme
MKDDCDTPARAEKITWQKLKNRDIGAAEKLLREAEENYVSACGRFLAKRTPGDGVWKARGRNKELLGLLINSRSTVMPVLPGRKDIASPDFLKSLLRKKRIHSVLGLKEEVLILESYMNKMGAEITDIFDYDLMRLDGFPDKNYLSSGPSNLVLRKPRLVDLDEVAPLQAAYEKEEVLPRGSVFSPASSRVNISNIIANGHILAAEICGRLVGKININAISFTRYQIGGVYVHPDFRGLGIARRMAGVFIDSLAEEGRGITLFVKKSNAAARKLYAGLGFKVTGDYRINYY